MIFLLIGEDSFQIKEKEKELVEKFSPQPLKEVLYRFNLKEDFQEVIEKEIQTPSFFNQRKIFILENPDKNPNFQSFFLRNLSLFEKSEDIFILIQGGKIKNRSFFQKLKAHSCFFEFKLFSEKELIEWAKKKAKKLSLSFSPKAFEVLLERCGKNPWRIERELEKLSLFQEKGGVFTEKEILELVPFIVEENIFSFVNALLERDVKKAIFLFREYLFSGERLNFLFPILRSQIRDLMFTISLFQNIPSFAPKLLLKRFHPYRAKILMENARKFDLENLKRVYFKIFELEVKTKTGELTLPTIFSIFRTI